MSILIGVSHGHEIWTPGKRTPAIVELGGRVIHENEFNKATAYKFMADIARMGFKTIDVSSTDNDTLQDRVTRANNAGCAIFIAFHYNASDGAFDEENPENDPSGLSIFHYPGSKNGLKLATCIHKYLVQGTVQKDRGVKAENFYVLHYTDMPAVLSENGFMDNKAEALLMLDGTFQQEVATEHAKGVCDYFNVKYIEPTTDTTNADIITQLKAALTAMTIDKNIAEDKLTKIKSIL